MIKLLFLTDTLYASAGVNNLVVFPPAVGTAPAHALMDLEFDAKNPFLETFPRLPEISKIDLVPELLHDLPHANNITAAYEYIGSLANFFRTFCKKSYNTPRPLIGTTGLHQVYMLLTPTAAASFDSMPTREDFWHKLHQLSQPYFDYPITDSLPGAAAYRIHQALAEHIPFEQWPQIQHTYWVPGPETLEHTPITPIFRTPMNPTFYIDRDLNFCLVKK